jgi:hypothetical protein
MSCFDVVLCHSRLIWVAETYVYHTLFISGLSGSASLSSIYFTIFAGDAVYTEDIQTQSVKMREAIEIQLHPNNFNRDRGFTWSQA